MPYSLAQEWLTYFKRRLDMIDQSVINLNTAVSGLGTVVGKLSTDVNAVVQRLNTTDFTGIDAENKAAVDADVQLLQQVAGTLAQLDAALTPPAATGATGA